MLRILILIGGTLLGPAFANPAFSVPEPEPYYSAVSPIFAYDPAYGPLLGVAWFSYPSGLVPDAAVSKDLNLISRFGPHGALSYSQRMPRFHPEFGLNVSVGIDNFFDYETVGASADIASTSEQLSLKANVRIRRALTGPLEGFVGTSGEIQWHETQSNTRQLRVYAGFASDTRDDSTNARQGIFTESTLNALPASLDSYSDEPSFLWANEARLFVPVWSDASLAIRGMFETSNGNSLQPTAGGSELLRGYLGGQFESRSMLASQAEFRFPIWSFIRGVSFYDVAWMIEDESEEHYQSAGFGFRFGLPPDQSISVRWDNAVNDEGQWQSIVNFNHVF